MRIKPSVSSPQPAISSPALRLRLRQVAAGLAGLLCTSFFAPAHATLQISSQATSNVTCSGNVCAATTRDAVLNVTHLARLLAKHDITVSSGGIARDVVLVTSFNWTSAYALTLDAARSIRIGDLLNVAGPGALIFRMNDGGTGGALSFHGGGRVAFNALTNTLIINGLKYSLASSIAEIASAIAAKPSGN